ncbi:MAG: 5-formyltetrahydrofolate cyclo-ligase [Flavobacteriaceae bacterium]
MLKKDLRSHYSKLRTNISPEFLLNSSLTIANKLLQLPIWSFDNYHIFLSISKKKEINTSFILAILQGKAKNIIFPKVASENSLKHFLLSDNTKLQENSWGVPEPVDGVEIAPNKIDLVFVPLLVFDKKGNRVGYGKGFYDDFLSKCRPTTVKIGLSLFEAENKITDLNEHDIPLNYCVTPNTVYSFTTD